MGVTQINVKHLGATENSSEQLRVAQSTKMSNPGQVGEAGMLARTI